MATEAFAQSSPFSGLVGKFQDVIEDLKVFVGVAIGALILWTLIELARGNGMAWGKLGLAIFGLFVLADYENIVSWFGGFTVR